MRAAESERGADRGYVRTRTELKHGFSEVLQINEMLVTGPPEVK